MIFVFARPIVGALRDVLEKYALNVVEIVQVYPFRTIDQKLSNVIQNLEEWKVHGEYYRISFA